MSASSSLALACLLICLANIVSQALDCACKFQGKILPDQFVSEHPLEAPGKWKHHEAITTYGTMCAAWDQMPGTPYVTYCNKSSADFAGNESWCQVPWCYVDSSCPSAFPSSVFNGSSVAYFSYAACGNAPNCYVHPIDSRCPYDPNGEKAYRIYKHSCNCTFQGQLLSEEVIKNYPLGSPGKWKDYDGIRQYGTTCAAWDQRPFTPWALEFCPPESTWCDHHTNWCQVPWCYVDESCPTKQPSSVWQGSTSVYYSYDTCLSAPDCFSNSVVPENWTKLPEACPWDGKGISWFTAATCPNGYVNSTSSIANAGGTSGTPIDNTQESRNPYTVWHMVDIPNIKCDSTNKDIDKDLADFQGEPGVWKATVESFHRISDSSASSPSEAAMVTFFRNSEKEANITFNLTDYEGRVVLPDTTVTLVAPASRRLASTAKLLCSETCISTMDGFCDDGGPASDFSACVLGTDCTDCGSRSALLTDDADSVLIETCEEFWMSDGRSPVEIPDTWGEARQEFQAICAFEGLSTHDCSDIEKTVFKGYPFDFDTPLLMRPTACTELFHRVFLDSPDSSLFQPRRLKGVGSRGIGSRSSASLSSSYSNGYTSTSYGYHGVGYTDGRVTRTAMYSGAFIGARLHMHTTYSRHYSRRRGHTSCSYRDARNMCIENVSHEGSMLRDDIADSTFIWTDFSSPFTLTISKVDGADYETSRICPPDDYCLECFENVSVCPTCSSFRDPANQDLFVTFSEATMDPEEWCFDPRQPTRSMVPWSQCSSGATCCDDTVTPQMCQEDKNYCDWLGSPRRRSGQLCLTGCADKSGLSYTRDSYKKWADYDKCLDDSSSCLFMLPCASLGYNETTSPLPQHLSACSDVCIAMTSYHVNTALDGALEEGDGVWMKNGEWRNGNTCLTPERQSYIILVLAIFAAALLPCTACGCALACRSGADDNDNEDDLAGLLHGYWFCGSIAWYITALSLSGCKLLFGIACAVFIALQCSCTGCLVASVVFIPMCCFRRKECAVIPY